MSERPPQGRRQPNPPTVKQLLDKGLLPFYNYHYDSLRWLNPIGYNELRRFDRRCAYASYMYNHRRAGSHLVNSMAQEPGEPIGATLYRAGITGKQATIARLLLLKCRRNEIAALLGMPVGSVYRTIEELRNRLKERSNNVQTMA